MSDCACDISVLLVVFYNIIDFIEVIYNKLSEKVNKVSYFPLFLYSRDVNNKKDNYFELLNSEVKKHDVILFICIDIDLEELCLLRKCNKDKQFIMLGYDEPFSFHLEDIHYEKKCSYFDIVFTPLKELHYKNHIYFPPGAIKLQRSKDIQLLQDINNLSYNDKVEKISRSQSISSTMNSYTYYLCILNDCKVLNETEYSNELIITWDEWVKRLVTFLKKSNINNSSMLITLKKWVSTDTLLDYIDYISANNNFVESILDSF